MQGINYRQVKSLETIERFDFDRKVYAFIYRGGTGAVDMVLGADVWPEGYYLVEIIEDGDEYAIVVQGEYFQDKVVTHDVLDDILREAGSPGWLVT